jgi:hypothetical protein
LEHNNMTAIAKALVAAQKAFGPALKSKNNPAFRSKYADLGACIEAVVDALNANGITLLQRTHPDDTGVTVETVLMHESGECWNSGPFHVPAAKQDPQGYGSALTYARRYSLMTACGIAPEDDDGNAASKRKAKMADNICADWRSYMDEATGSKELKARMAEAVQAAEEIGDSEAAAGFQTYAYNKLAAAKAKTTEAA